MSEYFPDVHKTGSYMFLPYFPLYAMNRDVVVMTMTFGRHKERGLDGAFWDRYASEDSRSVRSQSDKKPDENSTQSSVCQWMGESYNYQFQHPNAGYKRLLGH